MRKIILIILLIKIIGVEAQFKSTSTIPLPDSISNARLTGDYYYENKFVIGEPYFNKDWESGKVVLINGDTISVDKIKYNGLDDELIWLNSFHFQKIKIDKASIRSFEFNESQTQFIKINPFRQISDSVDYKFVQLAVEGPIHLYIHRMVSLNWPKYVVENNVRRKYDVLNSTPVYYFSANQGKLESITQLNRKKILRLFPAHKEIILTLSKQNQLNLKKEKDLILLIQLLNQKIK